MNFSRSAVGAVNPIPNRFFAAILAAFTALLISFFGSTQWASADSHDGTVTDPSPVPGTPTDVTARPGNEKAAVAWVPAFDDIVVDGFVIVARPSEITVEARPDDTMVIVEGLENGVEYVFTVVAFNENGRSEPSEPSNPVIPSNDRELTDEELERLRKHLQELAEAARKRFHDAQERARDRLDDVRDNVHDRLDNQTDRAREFLERTRDLAHEKHENNVDKARNWFDRFKDQLRKKVERAQGTDREDEVEERAQNALEDAKEKLTDRIDRSKEKTEDRIERAEDKAHDRIDRARDRAENAIDRAEERLTRRISNLADRLQELLERLRRIWAERAGEGA